MGLLFLIFSDMTLFKRNHSISLLLIAALLLPMSTFAATESTPIVATTSAVSSAQACLKPLFEKRETMITAAWDIEYIEIKKSMDTRKATILGALEMNDIKQSRKAISTAHRDFRD
jgi:hypothetical protein